MDGKVLVYELLALSAAEALDELNLVLGRQCLKFGVLREPPVD